jgi:hypothetical protein
MPTNYLPKTHAEGEYDAFWLQSLESEHAVDPECAAVRQHRFGLVNFHFQSTRPVAVERSYGTHYLLSSPGSMRSQPPREAVAKPCRRAPSCVPGAGTPRAQPNRLKALR